MPRTAVLVLSVVVLIIEPSIMQKPAMLGQVVLRGCLLLTMFILGNLSLLLKLHLKPLPRLHPRRLLRTPRLRKLLRDLGRLRSLLVTSVVR